MEVRIVDTVNIEEFLGAYNPKNWAVVAIQPYLTELKGATMEVTKWLVVLC